MNRRRMSNFDISFDSEDDYDDDDDVDMAEEAKFQICSISYSPERPMWYMFSCKHHVCYDCFSKRNRGLPHLSSNTCVVCLRQTSCGEVPLIRKLTGTIIDLRRQIERKSIKEAEVLCEGSEEKIKCQSCDISDFEQNLHLCQTCHELKFENSEDVKKHAICANCTIRKHIRQGHVTVDFLPYLRAYLFKTQSQVLKDVIADFNKVRVTRDAEVEKFRIADANLKQQFDQLTENMRRSKSTVQLIQSTEKLKSFIETSKTINLGLISHVQEQTAKIQNNSREVKNWSDKMKENCVEDKEVVNLGG